KLQAAFTDYSNDITITVALEKYYLSTMYSLEFIIGALGNIIVVFGYVFCLKKWKSGNIYLFNLSISDLLFLCTLPNLVNSYSKDQWAESTLCHSNRFLLHANLYSSVLFLMVISIDRYMLMKHPFRDHVLQKRNTAVVVSVAVWIGVILELLPLLYFLEPVTAANNYKCLDYASSGDPVTSLVYSMFLTVFGFLIPLLTMGCFYLKMVCFLQNRSEQIRSALTLEKPLTLVILTVVTFSLLFTPYHVMRNVRIASRIPALNISGGTAINPVFYFLMGDHFREMLMAKTRQLLGRGLPCLVNAVQGQTQPTCCWPNSFFLMGQRGLSLAQPSWGSRELLPPQPGEHSVQVRGQRGQWVPPAPGAPSDRKWGPKG
uniref:G-protein coupled receptors family 1 profile domain-containing protein n=1 Tax=Zonotrichia albicollis TaxID=44394 RepID=A0A8D2MWP2_ZONAL